MLNESPRILSDSFMLNLCRIESIKTIRLNVTSQEACVDKNCTIKMLLMKTVLSVKDYRNLGIGKVSNGAGLLLQKHKKGCSTT